MAVDHPIDATPEDEALVQLLLEQITGSKEIVLGNLYAVCAEIGKKEEMASIGRVALKYRFPEIAA